jgi:hypothetical protein
MMYQLNEQHILRRKDTFQKEILIDRMSQLYSYAPIWTNVAHRSGPTPAMRRALTAASNAYGIFFNENSSHSTNFLYTRLEIKGPSASPIVL